MKTNLRSIFALLMVSMLAVAFVACEGDSDETSSDSGAGSSSGSSSGSGSGSGSGSSTTYTLSALAGDWFGLDYGVALSQVETYVSQGNANQVKAVLDEAIYGFKITSAGAISEIKLTRGTSSTSGGTVHKSFFVGGEAVFWMLSDVGSYLTGVSIVGDEIISNGTTYFTIWNATWIDFFNSDPYFKR